MGSLIRLDWGAADRPGLHHGDRNLLGGASEVALGRARVAGQREAGERRERQVRCPADTGLEHPAAPDRHAEGAAGVVDAHGLEETPHPSLLDVHDPTGAQIDRGSSVCRRADRLVQAQVGSDLPLQRSMFDEIVVVERLLDHEQVEGVEGAEDLDVLERVRGVRIDRQQDVRVRRAHGPDALDVRARLELELDPPVPLG
jgi:hypothetical protein